MTNQIIGAFSIATAIACWTITVLRTGRHAPVWSWTEIIETTPIQTFIIIITIITIVFYTQHTILSNFTDLVTAAETGLRAIIIFSALGSNPSCDVYFYCYVGFCQCFLHTPAILFKWVVDTIMRCFFFLFKLMNFSQIFLYTFLINPTWQYRTHVIHFGILNLLI